MNETLAVVRARASMWPTACQVPDKDVDSSEENREEKGIVTD